MTSPLRHPRADRITASTRPTIAVALGAGGARGIAHIAVLEALDELGLEVVALAGTSMGAIIGAAYAAGLTGADLRAHVTHTLRNRAEVLSRVLKARVGKFTLAGLGANPMLVDGEACLDLFWPRAVPGRRQIPQALEATFGTAQIMQAAITREMLRLAAPDILVRPPVETFKALDFFHVTQILAAAESSKDEIKRQIEKRLKHLSDR